MDRLWNRISEEIDKRETGKENETTYTDNRSQIKSSSVYTRIAAVAAAFIVVFAGVNIVNEANRAKTSQDSIPTSRPEKTETDTSTVDKPEPSDETNAEDFNGSTTIESIKYEQLSFNDTDTVAYKASYIPTGDEYFVEKNVLMQTDVFADVTVLEADLTSASQAVYTLRVEWMSDKSSYVDLDEDEIIIKSSTPYILQENREYLIPLSVRNGEFFIVFENAPQIEITLDGGLVFQNGWNALAENSSTLEKKSLNVNDFYFDRMKYSPAADIELLFIEWKQA